MARGGQRETSPDGFCYVFPVASAAANVRRCRFAHQNIPARRQHRSNVRVPLHNRSPERGFYAAVAALNVPHTPRQRSIALRAFVVSNSVARRRSHWVVNPSSRRPISDSLRTRVISKLIAAYYDAHVFVSLFLLNPATKYRFKLKTSSNH